jgi:asparagine synthase (glutamine-hydrolysing)
MCGIFAIHGTDSTNKIPKVNTLSHRGPDDFNAKRIGKTYFEFHRLAINGAPGPGQPIQFGDLSMIANAEIYNYIELGGFPGESDCEVVPRLVAEHGLFRTCEMISGDFALVISDGEHVWAARDRVGVRPLFWTRTNGTVAFASEAKALTQFGSQIEIFPPGHLYDSKLDALVCWAPNYWDGPRQDNDVAYVREQIRDLMFKAVDKRVHNTRRPVGFFLSGGLDSSIIAALGKKCLGGTIKTFAVGLADSPDLLAARKMAEHLKSDHTEVIFTVEEGLKALRDVIWHLETFDTTTVRASVPMFILSKYIKDNTDIRVVLSGEGADELFGGYLYFHNAPHPDAFAAETMRLVRDVHLFDVLRADRTTAAHGLELRVPFFDRDVIDYVMDGFDPELKMPKAGFEKHLLREALGHLLPRDVAWRQKNGMSDAVGYSWVDALKATGEDYRKIFHEHFGKNLDHLSPYKWLPKWSDSTDPSARTLSQFNDKIEPPLLASDGPLSDDEVMYIVAALNVARTIMATIFIAGAASFFFPNLLE